MKFSTKLIHGSKSPEQKSKPLAPAITLSTTFYYNESDYKYSRSNNPNRNLLEEKLAVLENAKFCSAFSSGVAAISSILMYLKPGDSLIVNKAIYGGTFRIIKDILEPFNIRAIWCNLSNLEEAKKLILPSTKMVYFETPSNPLLKIFDIKAIAKFAFDFNLISVCDNTFLSPYFQNPLELGISVVVHSTSKFLGGHSDITGGAVMTNDEKLYTHIKMYQKTNGAVPSPFDTWLTERSLKTLAVRLNKQDENARALATFLKESNYCKMVYYPGLYDDEESRIHKSQATGGGAVVSADFGSQERALGVVLNFELFAFAESLGGVESIVSHPFTMSHSFLSPEEKEENGITPGLLRFSCGLEDSNDLISDIKKAVEEFDNRL